MVIVSDLFGIADRLREIDPLYFVVYSERSGRFELHRDAGSFANTYQTVLPFDRLDSRTVCYARETRAERRAKLIADIDESNRLLEKEWMYESKKKFCDDLESGLTKL